MWVPNYVGLSSYAAADRVVRKIVAMMSKCALYSQCDRPTGEQAAMCDYGVPEAASH